MFDWWHEPVVGLTKGDAVLTGIVVLALLGLAVAVAMDPELRESLYEPWHEGCLSYLLMGLVILAVLLVASLFH